MQYQIVEIKEKQLTGKRLAMSLTSDRTADLWRSFMPRRGEIRNVVNHDLISMQVYDELYFENFHPSSEFEKWAAVEVADAGNVPADMESFTLPGGMYAVFIHKGLSSDHSTFNYIFTEWLPNSDYELDNRPHFELLGQKYRNNDPDSEEQIWIPVREKT